MSDEHKKYLSQRVGRMLRPKPDWRASYQEIIWDGVPRLPSLPMFYYKPPTVDFTDAPYASRLPPVEISEFDVQIVTDLAREKRRLTHERTLRIAEQHAQQLQNEGDPHFQHVRPGVVSRTIGVQEKPDGEVIVHTVYIDVDPEQQAAQEIIQHARLAGVSPYKLIEGRMLPRLPPVEYRDLHERLPADAPQQIARAITEIVRTPPWRENIASDYEYTKVCQPERQRAYRCYVCLDGTRFGFDGVCQHCKRGM